MQFEVKLHYNFKFYMYYTLSGKKPLSLEWLIYTLAVETHLTILIKKYGPYNVSRRGNGHVAGEEVHNF